MKTFENILLRQAMQMIEEQDLRGWTESHDELILNILKEKLNESQ